MKKLEDKINLHKKRIGPTQKSAMCVSYSEVIKDHRTKQN